MSNIHELTTLVQQLVATVVVQATDMQKVHRVLDTLNRTPIADSAISVDTEVQFTSLDLHAHMKMGGVSWHRGN